jgi:resuscitation-promoting factor RpfA
MMTTNRLYAPTRALPAIAAALALSSTPLFAQEAQPSTTPPATTVEPAPETPAPATDTTTAAPATDTSTPAATTTATRSVKRTVRTARTSAARPAPVAAPTVTRTVAKRAAVSAAPATAAATPAPAAAAPPAPQAAPVVRLDAKPAPAAKTPSSQPIDNDTLEIAGGGLLALLALGGIASVVIGRRRQRREKEMADAQVLAYEPFETAAAPEPAPAAHHEEPATAASAFAWGDQAQGDEPAPSSDVQAVGDDRRPGESWVERAYRGPSANNPSVSLRTRLKRAAFFDKREREAAAGTAEPVDASAGLPEAMVEEQERELA